MSETKSGGRKDGQFSAKEKDLIDHQVAENTKAFQAKYQSTRGQLRTLRISCRNAVQAFDNLLRKHAGSNSIPPDALAQVRDAMQHISGQTIDDVKDKRISIVAIEGVDQMVLGLSQKLAHHNNVPFWQFRRRRAVRKEIVSDIERIRGRLRKELDAVMAP